MEQNSKINSFPNFGNHRRFKIRDLLKTAYPHSNKLHIGYARVSTHGQKEDLQIKILEHSIRNDHKMVIFDLGSGLNYKKKGLKKLFNLIIHDQVDTLYLTHKDRLLRFGSEIFFKICEYVGIKLLNQN